MNKHMPEVVKCTCNFSDETAAEIGHYKEGEGTKNGMKRYLMGEKAGYERGREEKIKNDCKIDGHEKENLFCFRCMTELIKEKQAEARTEERQKILRVLEGIEKGIKWMQEGNNKKRIGYTDGWNEALTEVGKRIKESK